ncbi:hypothetical protein ACFWVC_14535 [Streptomyces sp. NPDC058691]|uniref:hypothetical protein n=1 Tax=Streptomyces sp. NPDC058691 TaxID=3346601 RepID=UPI0036484122
MNTFTKSLATAAAAVLLAAGGMTASASAAPSGHGSGHGKKLHCSWHKGYWTYRHTSGRGDHDGRGDRDRRGGHAGSSHGSLRWEKVWHPAYKVCVRR